MPCSRHVNNNILNTAYNNEIWMDKLIVGQAFNNNIKQSYKKENSRVIRHISRDSLWIMLSVFSVTREVAQYNYSN